ncbi:hypothetical protein B7P43_G02806 [Cryptotermes secundus]|uniref:DUF4817 domain-containing protein n=1 Tax=Cryptotermes secundus TaxID=105785 RepID=A0A2J7RSS7_9NEOP|nr:hypothetical protein B7P43_G02806 [Cryptotermes secundus]
MRWTSEQRAFAVEAYFSNNHSYVAVQRAFRTHFGIKPRGPVTDRKSIVLWVENFRTTGSVVKKSSGRQRTVTTPENVEAVRQSILRSPRRSARKHAVALDISNRSMRRILHAHLHFHPYKMVVSDEAHFYLSSCRVGVIGPYFFEEDNHAVTVNSQRYVIMFENFFEPALEEMHLGNVWFQQDGATAHTARASMTDLRAKFPGRLISLRGDIPWAAHSPDLTPCDFFYGDTSRQRFLNIAPQTCFS